MEEVVTACFLRANKQVIFFWIGFPSKLWLPISWYIVAAPEVQLCTCYMSIKMTAFVEPFRYCSALPLQTLLRKIHKWSCTTFWKLVCTNQAIFGGSLFEETVQFLEEAFQFAEEAFRFAAQLRRKCISEKHSECWRHFLTCITHVHGMMSQYIQYTTHKLLRQNTTETTHLVVKHTHTTH